MGLLGRSVPRGRASLPGRTRPPRGAFDEIEDGASRPTERVDPRRRPVVAAKDNVLRRERHQPDWSILVAVVALAAIGILMVYSSSAMRAYVQQDDTLGIVGPQILWAALGLIAMLVMMRVDYRLLRFVSMPAYVVAIGLLILVFVPGLGKVVGGSARWLDIHGLPGSSPGRDRQAGPHRLPGPLAVVTRHPHQGFPVRHDTRSCSSRCRWWVLSSRSRTSAPRPSSLPRRSRCSSSPELASGSSGPWA